MIKFFIKSGVFILLAVVLLLQLDGMFYKDGLFRDTMNVFQESTKDYNLVFIGNSHSHSSFDPRVFEVTLGARTINLGAPAQRLVTTKVVADMLLQETQPELVVINIFSMSLNEPNNKAYKAFQLGSLDFLPHSLEKTKTIASMFAPTEWPTAFSETLRYHYNWDNLSSPKKPYNFNLNYDVYKGFATYKSTYDSVSYKKFLKKFENRDTKVASLSALQQNRIDEIIKMFEEKKIPILFVNAPAEGYDVSDNFKSYAETISDYIQEKGKPIVDFNLIKDSLGLIQKHYRDPNHLNTRGALVVSEYLSQYIASNFEITATISKEELQRNRYYLMKNDFTNTLKTTVYNTSSDIYQQGFLKAHLFATDRNRMEITFEVDDEIFQTQKLLLQYGFKDNKPDAKKFKTWITLKKEDIITYNNKKYAVVTLFPWENELYDLELQLLTQANPVMLVYDYLKL